jgi:hypothetical protein
VACGVSRIVFAGMAGKLAKLAGGVLMTHYTRSRVPHDLLADITRAAGGTPGLAAQVEAANSARHAAELWDEAGLLPAAGTELCRRVADVLARFAAEVATGTEPAAGAPSPAAPGAPSPAAPGAPSPAAPGAPSPAAPGAATSADTPSRDSPPAPAPPGSAPGTSPPMSVRVIMVDFSGKTQLAAYPPADVPGEPA